MNEVVFLIIVLSAYILPVVIVLNSKRTQGPRKECLVNRYHLLFVVSFSNVLNNYP